jgi:hypothetical protein
MNNKTDIYIRVSLKNWAARQAPPNNGRQELFKQIMKFGRIDESTSSPPDVGSLQIAVSQKQHPPPEERPMGPLTTARLWSLQMASRLVF